MKQWLYRTLRLPSTEMAATNPTTPTDVSAALPTGRSTISSASPASQGATIINDKAVTTFKALEEALKALEHHIASETNLERVLEAFTQTPLPLPPTSTALDQRFVSATSACFREHFKADAWMDKPTATYTYSIQHRPQDFIDELLHLVHNDFDQGRAWVGPILKSWTALAQSSLSAVECMCLCRLPSILATLLNLLCTRARRSPGRIASLHTFEQVLLELRGALVAMLKQECAWIELYKQECLGTLLRMNLCVFEPPSEAKSQKKSADLARQVVVATWMISNDVVSAAVKAKAFALPSLVVYIADQKLVGEVVDWLRVLIQRSRSVSEAEWSQALQLVRMLVAMCSCSCAITGELVRQLIAGDAFLLIVELITRVVEDARSFIASRAASTESQEDVASAASDVSGVEFEEEDDRWRVIDCEDEGFNSVESSSNTSPKLDNDQEQARSQTISGSGEIRVSHQADPETTEQARIDDVEVIVETSEQVLISSGQNPLESIAMSLIDCLRELILVGSGNLPLPIPQALPFPTDAPLLNEEDDQTSNGQKALTSRNSDGLQLDSQHLGGRVRNLSAFHALMAVFGHVQRMKNGDLKQHLLSHILNHILSLFCGHPDNFRLCGECKPLHMLVEMLPSLEHQHQSIVIKMFEYVSAVIGEVPFAELCALSDVLQMASTSRSLSSLHLLHRAMPTLCRIAESHALYRDAFRCCGLLRMLTQYCSHIHQHHRSNHNQDAVAVDSSTFTNEVQTERDFAEEHELAVDVLLCLRAALWQSPSNQALFRSVGACTCLAKMTSSHACLRVHALSVLECFVDDEGISDMLMMLQSARTNCAEQIDVITSLRRLMSGGTQVQEVFRISGGFENVFSAIAALDGALAYSSAGRDSIVHDDAHELAIAIAEESDHVEKQAGALHHSLELLLKLIGLVFASIRGCRSNRSYMCSSGSVMHSFCSSLRLTGAIGNESIRAQVVHALLLLSCEMELPPPENEPSEFMNVEVIIRNPTVFILVLELISEIDDVDTLAESVEQILAFIRRANRTGLVCNKESIASADIVLCFFRCCKVLFESRNTKHHGLALEFVYTTGSHSMSPRDLEAFIQIVQPDNTISCLSELIQRGHLSGSFVEFCLSESGSAYLDIGCISAAPSFSQQGFSSAFWICIRRWTRGEVLRVFELVQKANEADLQVAVTIVDQKLRLRSSLGRFVHFDKFTFEPQRWYHVVVQQQPPKSRSGLSGAEMFIDGRLEQELPLPFAFSTSSNANQTFCCNVGTTRTHVHQESLQHHQHLLHVDRKHQRPSIAIAPSDLLWWLGPFFFAAGTLSLEQIQEMFGQGPYSTSMFHTRRVKPIRKESSPGLSFSMSSEIEPSASSPTSRTRVSSSPPNSSKLSLPNSLAFKSSWNVLFAVHAHHKSTQALSATLSIDVNDVLVASTLSPDCLAFALAGARCIHSTNTADVLPSLGGIQSLLMFVQEAATCEELFDAISLLCLSLRRARSLLDEMDRVYGYKILAMLLRHRSHLIDERVLLSLITLVQDQHENGVEQVSGVDVINNLSAFEDVILNPELFLSLAIPIQYRILQRMCRWIIECPLTSQVQEIGLGEKRQLDSSVESFSEMILRKIMPHVDDSNEPDRSYNAMCMQKLGLVDFLLQILLVSQEPAVHDGTIAVIKALLRDFADPKSLSSISSYLCMGSSRESCLHEQQMLAGDLQCGFLLTQNTTDLHVLSCTRLIGVFSTIVRDVDAAFGSHLRRLSLEKLLELTSVQWIQGFVLNGVDARFLVAIIHYLQLLLNRAPSFRATFWDDKAHMVALCSKMEHCDSSEDLLAALLAFAFGFQPFTPLEVCLQSVSQMAAPALEAPSLRRLPLLLSQIGHAPTQLLRVLGHCLVVSPEALEIMCTSQSLHMLLRQCSTCQHDHTIVQPYGQVRCVLELLAEVFFNAIAKLGSKTCEASLQILLDGSPGMDSSALLNIQAYVFECLLSRAYQRQEQLPAPGALLQDLVLILPVCAQAMDMGLLTFSGASFYIFRLSLAALAHTETSRGSDHPQLPESFSFRLAMESSCVSTLRTALDEDKPCSDAAGDTDNAQNQVEEVLQKLHQNALVCFGPESTCSAEFVHSLCYFLFVLTSAFVGSSQVGNEDIPEMMMACLNVWRDLICFQILVVKPLLVVDGEDVFSNVFSLLLEEPFSAAAFLQCVRDQQVQVHRVLERSLTQEQRARDEAQSHNIAELRALHFQRQLQALEAISPRNITHAFSFEDTVGLATPGDYALDVNALLVEQARQREASRVRLFTSTKTKDLWYSMSEELKAQASVWFPSISVSSNIEAGIWSTPKHEQVDFNETLFRQRVKLRESNREFAETYVFREASDTKRCRDSKLVSKDLAGRQAARNDEVSNRAHADDSDEQVEIEDEDQPSVHAEENAYEIQPKVRAMLLRASLSRKASLVLNEANLAEKTPVIEKRPQAEESVQAQPTDANKLSKSLMEMDDIHAEKDTLPDTLELLEEMDGDSVSGAPDEDNCDEDEDVDDEKILGFEDDMVIGEGDEDIIADLNKLEGLFSVLVPGDELLPSSIYNCARISGLDARYGIAAMGRSNLYVIDDFKLTPVGQIRKREEDPNDIKAVAFEVSFSEQTQHAIGSAPYIRVHRKISKEMTKQSIEDVTKLGCAHVRAYSDIRELHKRNYQLQGRALEVFFTDGSNFMLVLENDRIRDSLFGKIRRMPMPESIYGMSDADTNRFRYKRWKDALEQKWKQGHLSNFAYLMHLNTLSGRSFNDLSKYPVMPFVLSDYTSDRLDLSDDSVYRDLRLPMGAIGEKRAEQFRQRFECWDDPECPPFHYGTHYSSAATVLYYLVRLEPFTRIALQLQGGVFDHTDRIFRDIGLTWRQASSEGALGDVKELIPELFCLPEMLLNSNRFEFGKTQKAEHVDDVILPPWAKNDPHLFVRLHRKALESKHVSDNLHHWIDLIYGYKQRGLDAVQAQNVFYHLTYEGACDIDSIEDELEKRATIEQINSFGQTPKQIFFRAHPARRVPANAIALCSQPHILTSRPFKQKSSCIRELQWLHDRDCLVAATSCSSLCPPKFRMRILWTEADHSIRFVPSSTSRKESKAPIDVLSVHEGLHGSAISCVALSEDGKYVVIGCTNALVCVYRLYQSIPSQPQRLVLRTRFCSQRSSISSVCVSSAFSLIVIGEENGAVTTFDLARLCLLRRLVRAHDFTYSYAPHHDFRVGGVSVSDRNGDIVAGVGDALVVFSINGKLLASVQTSARVTSVALSQEPEWLPDEPVVITGHEDGAVALWSLEIGHQHSSRLDSVNEYSSTEMDSMSSSHLEQLIEAGSKTVLILRNRLQNKAHSSPVTALHANGKRLSTLWSGDAQGNIREWNVPASRVPTKNDSGSIGSCGRCDTGFGSLERRYRCCSCGGVFCRTCSHETSSTGSARTSPPTSRKPPSPNNRSASDSLPPALLRQQLNVELPLPRPHHQRRRTSNYDQANVSQMCTWCHDRQLQELENPE